MDREQEARQRTYSYRRQGKGPDYCWHAEGRRLRAGVFCLCLTLRSPKTCLEILFFP
jgi:hypothetical protein